MNAGAGSGDGLPPGMHRIGGVAVGGGAVVRIAVVGGGRGGGGRGEVEVHGGTTPEKIRRD